MPDEQLDPYAPERPVGEECGVFGVWAPDEDVAKLAYYGMYALQHRGQEAAGMAVSDGSAVLVYKDLGLVAQVFDEAVLSSLRGHLAIGHTSYSTTGAGTGTSGSGRGQAGCNSSAGTGGGRTGGGRWGRLPRTERGP